MDAKVSIIIPNYNYGRFVAEAIESVLAQTLPADEIIVIDDCSTDDSVEIINKYSNRVKIVVNDTNLGIVNNFNKAVDLASGDLIGFLGADNRMRSDYVELCSAALNENPDAAVVYTDILIFGPLADSLAERVGATRLASTAADAEPVFYWTFPEVSEQVLKDMKTKNFIHGSSMYRKSAWKACGGYQASEGPEDHNLFTRMLQLGKPVRVPEAVIEYRQHSLEQANTVLQTQVQLAETALLLEQERKNRGRIELSLANANTENSRLEAKLAELAERQVALNTQLVRVKLQRDSNRQHLDRLRESTSWRITKPLRSLRRLLKSWRL